MPAGTVIHQAAPMNRPARVVIHPAPPSAHQRVDLQGEQEGGVIELGDAMKTRVHIHGQGPPQQLGTPAGTDPMRTRVVMTGENQGPQPNVRTWRDPSLKRLPDDALTPEQVLAELEQQRQQLTGQKKAIEAKLRECNTAIEFCKGAEMRAAKAALEGIAQGAGASKEGALTSFDEHTIAESMPFIMQESDNDVLVNWSKTEAEGHDRAGIHNAIEHRVAELAEIAEAKELAELEAAEAAELAAEEAAAADDDDEDDDDEGGED